eukprot:6488297-Amphidinium_carterae.2
MSAFMAEELWHKLLLGEAEPPTAPKVMMSVILAVGCMSLFLLFNSNPFSQVNMKWSTYSMDFLEDDETPIVGKTWKNIVMDEELAALDAGSFL